RVDLAAQPSLIEPVEKTGARRRLLSCHSQSVSPAGCAPALRRPRANLVRPYIYAPLGLWPPYTQCMTPRGSIEHDGTRRDRADLFDSDRAGASPEPLSLPLLDDALAQQEAG